MENNRKLSQYLKLGIIIVMVIVFSSYPTFAEECSGDAKETLDMLNTFITNLGRFCSWIWIILGNIAGVLMTNVMVYGEFMHLDNFLWKIWQLTRSIANYALGFLFIYSIFKYIFFKIDKPPMDQIKNILVASVLVQASWFLVMVLVDLSTIALATVSSFPAQVLSDNSTLMQTMKGEMVGSRILNDKKIVVINAFSDEYLKGDNDSWYSIEKGGDDSSVDPEKKTVDAMMPSANNLGGPFIYLGATAFEPYKNRQIPESADCVGATEKVITNFLFDAGTTILYSLALILFIVLLVMRLVYLWIFIAISPIVILLSVVKVIKINKNDDILSLSKAVGLIFKPVVFALWMSLMFLVVIVFQGVLNKSITSTFPGDVSTSGSGNLSTSRDVVPKVSSSLEDAGIVSVYLKEGTRTMKDIILSFIVLVLMWQMVKMALTSSFAGFSNNNSIAKKMESIVRKTGEAIGSIGVIPTPEGRLGFNNVWDGDSSRLIDGTVAGLETQFKKRDKSTETVLDFLGKGGGKVVRDLSDNEKKTCLMYYLRDSSGPDVFVKELNELRKKYDGFRFQNLRGEINQWIMKFGTLDPKDPNYLGMRNYFGSSGGKYNWDEIANAAKNSKGTFDIVNWWNGEGSNKGFSDFYEKVLRSGETDIKEKYNTYKDFETQGREEIRKIKSGT